MNMRGVTSEMVETEKMPPAFWDKCLETIAKLTSEGQKRE